MDKHKLDSDIKALFEHTNNYYEALALEGKSRVWDKVQHRNSKKYSALLVRVLAIACILLLLITSGLYVTLLNSKKTNQKLAEKNSKNESQLSSLKIQSSSEQIHTTDTVFVTKKEYVNQPVIVTKTRG